MVAARLQKHQNKISVLNRPGRREPFADSRVLTGLEQEGLRITIVLKGPKGEEGGIAAFQTEDFGFKSYSLSSREELEGEKRLLPAAMAGEIMDDKCFALITENGRLKQLNEELMQENQVLKKRLTGLGWSCE